MYVFVCGELCLFVRPPGVPHLIVHPQLIAVWISERNASCPNSKSMSLIFQLDLVLYRNLSKMQDLWVRDNDLYVWRN